MSAPDPKLHREDGPAEIVRRADGTMFESYWRHGKRDREDGPAEIARYADGTVTESYWRDGKRIEPPRAASPTPQANAPRTAL